MTPDLVNIIFGLKIRQKRTQAELSLSEFAARCDLSPSYITEIEKGRKYPKTDKIMKIAEVLDLSYDELVSTKLAPSLTSLETMLSSPLLQHFPFEEFGLEVSDLVNLFTKAPVRASALLHAALDMARQYDLKEEHFLRAALRSYQELHENYFQDLEDAALAFTAQYQPGDIPQSLAVLTDIIEDQFSYQLDTTHLANHDLLRHYRSVFVPGHPPKLLINALLQDRQIKFLLLREMGYQVLGLKERAHTSAPDKVDSFQQVLNDFKASYFAGAVLLPRAHILAELQAFFQLNTWSPYRLLHMLEQYDVTPEMLLYRFSQLIPQFFGTRLHFLRFHNANGRYQLAKHLNMTRFLLPSGLNANEHFCRRWLPMRLLQAIQTADPDDVPVLGAQLSEFLPSKGRFLSFGFARPLALAPAVGSSVVIGFQVSPALKDIIRFVDDPDLAVTIVNETCERCPVDQCEVRATPPTLFEQDQQNIKQRIALNQLVADMTS